MDRPVMAEQVAMKKDKGALVLFHSYLFGHYGSIHPMDKTPVGKRLMLSAREHAYGETDVISTVISSR